MADDLTVVDSQPLPDLSVVSSAPLQQGAYDQLTQAGMTAKSPTMAERLRDKLGGYIDQKDHDALIQAAQTGKAPEGQVWSTFGPRMIKGLLDKVTSTLEPENAGKTAAVLAANSNPFTAIPVDAGLVAHGGYTAAKNAPAALSGNPEAIDAALSGASEAAGGAAGLGEKLPGTAASVNAARQSAAQKIVAPLVKKPLGATMEDIRFNRDPAAAISNEGLTGSKPELVKQAQQRIADLSNATDNILKNHPNANVQIDAAPIIDKAISDAQTAARKVGNKSAVNRLADLGDALKSEYGPIKGTPFEINNLKRDIGNSASDLGAFKSTDPIESSAAAAMGDVYKGLKNAVNAQVPEIAPINERVANLLSAKTGLNRNLALEENKSALSGMTLSNAPFKVAEKLLGSAPIRTNLASLLNPKSLDVPSIASAQGVPLSNLTRAAAPEASSTSTPGFAYRVRNQGEEGVPIGGSKSNAAHATTTLEDAQRLAPGRGSVEGEPQEIVKYDLSKLKEGKDYERVQRPGQPDWIRQLRPLKESELQLVKTQ
jgi:hypothetical protein